MPQRREIQAEKITSLIKRDSGEVSDVASEVLSQIMQHRSGSTDGCRALLQPKSIERGDFEMFAQSINGSLGSKDPVIIAVHNPAVAGAVILV